MSSSGSSSQSLIEERILFAYSNLQTPLHQQTFGHFSTFNWSRRSFIKLKFSSENTGLLHLSQYLAIYLFIYFLFVFYWIYKKKSELKPLWRDHTENLVQIALNFRWCVRAKSKKSNEKRTTAEMKKKLFLRCAFFCHSFLRYIYRHIWQTVVWRLQCKKLVGYIEIQTNLQNDQTSVGKASL